MFIIISPRNVYIYNVMSSSSIMKLIKTDMVVLLRLAVREYYIHVCNILYNLGSGFIIITVIIMHLYCYNNIIILL